MAGLPACTLAQSCCFSVGKAEGLVKALCGYAQAFSRGRTASDMTFAETGGREGNKTTPRSSISTLASG